VTLLPTITSWVVALSTVLSTAVEPPGRSRPRESVTQEQPATKPTELVEADRLLAEAGKLSAAGDRKQAASLTEQAIALREKSLGPNDPGVAEAVYSLASLLRGAGDNAGALPLLLRAVGILTKSGPESADLAVVLNTLGQTHQALGEYDKARPAFERALAIRERLLAADDPSVATSLNNLALLFHVSGAYGSAEPLYQRALAIREKKLGTESPLVAQSVNNLAQLYKDRGDYVAARPLLERALMLYEKTRGPDHIDTAAALNNLGLLLTDLGDYESAETLLTRALTIREKALPADHQLIAQSLNNLGLLFQKRTQYAKAEPLFVRSLANRERALGPDHPDVGRALNNLAVCHQEQGDLDRAEPLYQRSLAISEQRLGAGNRLTIQAVNNLAVLYLLRGDFARAEPLYLRSLRDAEQSFGPQDPLVAIALLRLAIYYERKGDLARAIETQRRATDVTETHLALLVGSGSEQQKRRYLTTLDDETNITLSLHFKTAPSSADAARLGALTVLRRKGRVLDAMSLGIEALRAGLVPADRELLDNLSSTRTRLASLVLEGPVGDRRAERDAEIARLERDESSLETAISSRSAAFRAETEPVTLESVRKALPRDAALVEIALYRPFDSKATRVVERFGAPRYVAYVLRADGSLQWADLGEAATIDALARDLRTALRDVKSKDVRKVAASLDARVFTPIEPTLGGATRVFVSPDGLLNLVPFAALAEDNGHYRIERYAFTYVTSGRDLLRMGLSTQSVSAPFVVANPAFDLDGQSPGAASERGVDLNRARFTPLPGTAGEAKALAGILPGAVVVTGSAATERAVKTHSSPSVLHIATHGFFVGLEASSPPTGGTRLLVMDEARTTADGNPLLRSGLAFAGANRRRGGDGEDGILLALEASALNLHGTRLVVLSACETGVGEVRAGDGVYGLRRALVLAGAESQVMSLWQVSDAATRDLMVAYYKRLRSGAGRADALRDVQLEMLRGTPRSHPFYWASFIQSGDWRPLTTR
jgi:CHAT domain-containing protein/Tfp pilus assembly protein PilF